MKNLRILKLLLLFSFINIEGYTQKNDEIVTSVPKTRVFYVGLDNELKVSPANTIVTLSSPGGSIHKQGEGKYVVRFQNPGTATMEFVSKTQTQRIAFPIKRIPDPKIVYCGQTGGNISKDIINKCSQLDIDMHEFIYDRIVLEIIKFNVIIKKMNKINNELAEPIVYENNGKVFSSKLTEELKKLNHGDTVIFQDILFETTKEIIRKYNYSLAFVIEIK
jgi:hypothetical protein